MSLLERSFLFVPGHQPEKFDKAFASGAHAVILDLEDAVAPDRKQHARQAVAAWLMNGQHAVVRINAAQTDWYEDDIAMLENAAGASVMLPKADEASLLLTTRALPGRNVIGLVETVGAYMELRRIVNMPGLQRIAFGSVDFATESGIDDVGEAMTSIRTQLVLESYHAGLLPPMDGVSLNFRDENQMRQDALRSRQLGFGGKLCIHPSQVLAVNAAFQPSLEEAQWARRVVEAFEASSGAATSVDGKMIDKPVVQKALQVMAEFNARNAD